MLQEYVSTDLISEKCFSLYKLTYGLRCIKCIRKLLKGPISNVKCNSFYLIKCL